MIKLCIIILIDYNHFLFVQSSKLRGESVAKWLNIQYAYIDIYENISNI